MKRLLAHFSGYGQKWLLGTLAHSGSALLFGYSPEALGQSLELSPLQLKLQPQGGVQIDLDDFGRYVSAAANEANLGRDAGWLVLGAVDGRDPSSGLRPVCGSRFAADAGHRNDIKRRVAEGTSPAVSLGESLEAQNPDCSPGSRVLIWRVPAAPAGMPVAWRGHFYGRDGEARSALALHKLETFRVQSAQRDWSAVCVEGALDVQARWQLSFYDSLIVAGALTAGCKTRLSGDLQRGRWLHGLTAVNRFQ